MPLARIPRVTLVVGLVSLVTAVSGDQGFWICLPVALLLAATEPSTRGALLAAAAVVVAAAIAAPPAVLPAIVVAPGSVAVLLLLRMRLEHERDTMRRYALRDPLTGLANRRVLDERIAYEIARHTRQDEPFVVLALDLDGFKAVNDRFGHEAGDEVLRAAAGALLEAVRAQDTVVRVGGDEFCILGPQTDRHSAAHLMERVLDSLADLSVGLSGLSASVGTAVFPQDGTTPATLLAAADTAALDAKRQRRAARPRRVAA